MPGDAPSRFDDPVLKTALKRAAGREAAPPGLRARVQQALASQGLAPAAGEPAVQRARRPGWRSNPLVGLAAAAMLILGIGLIFNHLWEPGDDLADRLPVAMASDMVDAHNRALAQPAIHGLEVARGDMDQIRSALKEKLGHPVLVASIGDDWDFQGARVTAVGQTPAAQLVFKRGEQFVSIFSVSGRAYYASQEGMQYKQTQDGHPIAGFVQGGIVHCVVGSKDSRLSEKDLARIRDAVRKHLSDAPAGGATSSANQCDQTGRLARL